jgi:diguanylate cyclase (GGDEF)-like protein
MAHELWRERAEPLLSRWPIIVVLVTHAIMLTARMITVLSTPILSHADLFRSPAFAVMAFGTVLYTITLAFLLLSMSKERTERQHKIAALVDPLTGLSNRRAFIADAEGLIAARSSRSEPLAVLVADLDHFKKVNDKFGHAVGDRVLRAFADTVRRTAGGSDLAGRLGGEEFAIVLPGRSEESAITLAERIRRAFAESAAEVGGHAVTATVSIGVAVSRIGVHDLAGLIGQADQALYQAKAAGRNRVAAFDDAGTVASLVPDVEPVLRRIALRA